MQELNFSRDRVACNYAISAHNRGLTIKIREDLYSSFLGLLQRNQEEYATTPHRAGQFEMPNGKECWGIRECFGSFRTGCPNWVTFDCPLPRVYGENCLGLIQGDAVSISLDLVMGALMLLPTKPARNGEPTQLFDQVLLSQGQTDQSYALAGWIGVEFLEWLRAQPNGRLTGPTQAMQDIVNHVCQDAKKEECRATVHEGRLLLDVYGNSTDLAMYEDNRFGAHNVGNPAQQLLLLFGFACVCDLVQQPVACR